MSNQELIDKYLNGGLSAEEVTIFRTRLSKEPGLAKALADARQTQAITTAAIRQELRKRVDTAWQKKKGKSRLRSISGWSAVAAALILCLGIGWWYWDTSLQQGPDLFAAYFVPPPPPNTRAATASDSLWINALTAYRRGDYPEAIRAFVQLGGQPEINRKSEIQLLRGISYLADDQYEQAVLILQSVSPDSDLAQDAEWYTALAFLANKQSHFATPILKKIAANNRHFRRQEAADILRSLL